MCFGLYLQSLFLLSKPPHITHSTTESHACLKAISIADVQSLTTESGINVYAMDIHVIMMHLFKHLNHLDDNGKASGDITQL